MSTILEEPETVFDVEASPIRLGPESNGMQLTREEFLAIEDVDELYRYELLHGVVVVSPPAAEGERGPNGRLEQWLWNYADTHPNGAALDDSLFEQEIDTQVCIRRADRVIWAGLGRQPDPKSDVPTIVIEFVSGTKRDRKRDYEEKRKEYADIGVREYWIIDRFRRTLTVCKGAKDHTVFKESETYTTELLPGFELPLAKLLAVADRWKADD
jgi:Uma2 family endonuclease